MARIAFIGLGNMGGGMAANLAKAGHDVRAFDLSTDALERAEAAGCLPAESAAASSITVFPTPLKTMRSGGMPASSAR